jgi:hypothetical protein
MIEPFLKDQYDFQMSKLAVAGVAGATPAYSGLRLPDFYIHT